MIKLKDPRPGTRRVYDLGKSKIKKFSVQTLDENGRARNYDFDPEYDLILYVYSDSHNAPRTFREHKVQYGYMYQDNPDATYYFPVFREIPSGGDRKVNVWKISDNEWDELEVVRVSSNFYAYSLPENRSLERFLEGAEKVIDSQKRRITEKYNKDMSNQDRIRREIADAVTKEMEF